MYRATRARVFRLLEPGAEGSLSRTIDLSIMGLILANVVAVILATVDPLFAAYRSAFRVFEVASVAVFSVEYLCRIWACVEDPKYASPVVGRLRFAASPYILVDLLAILPFFLTAVVDLRVLRTLRLFRFFRLFKIARYSESMRTFGVVVREKSSDLAVSLFATGVLLTVASTLIYFAERGAQPETFSSIPASLWWSVITLTTVGYGDVTPVTTAGRVLGATIAIIGVGLVALPASILASGFIEAAAPGETATETDSPDDDADNEPPEDAEATADDPEAPTFCPHCGERLRR